MLDEIEDLLFGKPAPFTGRDFTRTVRFDHAVVGEEHEVFDLGKDLVGYQIDYNN